MWEQDGHAPVRARGAKDGGGPPAPPPLKVRMKSEVKERKEERFSVFSSSSNAGPGDAPKGTLSGFGGGMNEVFCIVSCWQSVRICKGFLNLGGFQCIRGGSVPPSLNF